MPGNTSLLRLFSILAIVALASWLRGDGWTVMTTTSAFSIHSSSTVCWKTTTTLAAEKSKRRKRKTGSNDDNGNDSLPDFDISDESSTASSLSDSKKKINNKDTGSTNIVGVFDEITPAMMASTTSYPKATSVSDLIRDRSLESKFQFDDEDSTVDTTLPDMATILPNTMTAIGTKKARQAARIAAAQMKQEEEDGNILSKIPFIRDEKGEISAVKILENGTWLGIGLLVGWELYLNSPFFDRAQPMIPIVYDIIL